MELDKWLEERGNYYVMRPKLIDMMTDVLELSPEVLRNVRIYKRKWYRYLPWYSAERGGGAITLGSRSWQMIIYTENFFEKAGSRDVAYGDNMRIWLPHLAHELGHVHHARRFGYFLNYLWQIALQYLRYGYDNAPLEIEAESYRLKFMHKYLHKLPVQRSKVV